MAVGLHLKDRQEVHTGHNFTFLGEKVLGIFSSHYEFAWDSPQQLNDQRYMVYTAEPPGRRVQRGREGGRQTRQTTTSQTVSQSGPRWVCGWRAEEERGGADSTHRPSVRAKSGHHRQTEDAMCSPAFTWMPCNSFLPKIKNQYLQFCHSLENK